MWREKYVSGFSFYIGFSGRSYKKGLPQEQEGDMEMISEIIYIVEQALHADNCSVY